MGGVEAFRQLAADLPGNFPAPVLMVLHIGHHHSVLPGLLKPKGPLAPVHAVDGAPLRAGQIVIAPPDQHLLVEGNHIRLSRGPKEHFSRPAIDPLFRSAAMSYGPGAVGVVLTGLLDDGTAGLQAIKACGGIAIVQDPADAQESSMPLSAMRHVDVDHCVPLSRMAEVCTTVMAQPLGPQQSIPAPLQHEHDLANKQGDAMRHLTEIGKPSTFVCPDCRGSLWEMNDARPPRFRCHTGHAYTLRTLQHAQSVATDEAMWNALRALQEQKFLLEKCLALASEPSDDAQWKAARVQLEQDLTALRKLIEQHVSPEEP